jgi:ubiquinone/menaquinone biosynthesis C-methylase UbiE
MMNLYENWILPRVLDIVMRNKEVTRYRSALVPEARGVVLEMGIGSGLNLPFYGPQVERLYAIDPSENLLRMARRRAQSMQFPVEFFARSGEAIPIEDHRVDTVLTTFTLCTIADPLAALREMRRVLRPAGRLLFAEHGLAPSPSVQRWQHRCNPLWNKIAGGCNLDRKMDELIGNAGFRFTELTVEYAKGPRPLSYIYAGSAQRA